MFRMGLASGAENNKMNASQQAEWIRRSIQDQAARRSGVHFDTLAEVQAWADSQDGGELAVRNALAEAVIRRPRSIELCNAWLAQQERQRTEIVTSENLELARRSAAASERAAQWAMVSAALSAAAVIGSALWTVFGTAVTAWISGRLH
jgi:hypothetical protein